MKTYFIKLAALLLFIPALQVMAQDSDEGEEERVPQNFNKKFHAGMLIGSYFANNYTAGLYDGYGRDFDNKKNAFENSNMYQKIILEYGGGYGGEDYIASALGIGHNDWTFTENDMPVNMRYKTSFIVGLNCKYTADRKNSIVFNLNAAKLTVGGNFTITTRPSSGATQINTSIKTFEIKGIEQRLLIQMGYQRILGNNETFNFFVEGGLNVTIARFDKNLIQINNLQIDLVQYYNQAGYQPDPGNKNTGVGFGAFAGFGVNLTTLTRWTIQLVYSPTFENINIGTDTRLKMQNGVGLRAYYIL